jgi:hypothetical protein
MTKQAWLNATATNSSDDAPNGSSDRRNRAIGRVRSGRSIGGKHRPTAVVSALTGVALLASAAIGLASPAAALCAATPNVTGKWSANDGGTYYMRRVGNKVWWLGDGPGDSWTNVFQGTTDMKTITGDWADVKGGRNSGTLTLKVNGEIGKGILGFQRIGSTGDGFAGARWWQPCNDTG